MAAERQRRVSGPARRPRARAARPPPAPPPAPTRDSDLGGGAARDRRRVHAECDEYEYEYEHEYFFFVFWPAPVHSGRVRAVPVRGPLRPFFFVGRGDPAALPLLRPRAAEERTATATTTQRHCCFCFCCCCCCCFYCFCCFYCQSVLHTELLQVRSTSVRRCSRSLLPSCTMLMTRG